MGYSGAIIKNNRNEILFQLRDEHGKNPNRWGIFGGGINRNESPLDALKRELREELGLQIHKSEIKKYYKIPFINYHIFEIYLEKKPKKYLLKEGKDMKFMKKEEFLKTKNALQRVKIFLRLFNRN